MIYRALMYGFLMVLLGMSRAAEAQPSVESPRERVSLSLMKDVTVNGGRIYLTDIAACSGNADLCRETGGIDISRSPQAGRSLQMSRTAIAFILQKEWTHVDVEFTGAESTRIVGAVGEVRADDVKQKLQSWLNDQIDYTSNLRLTVTKVSIPLGSGVRPSQTQVDFPDLEGLPFRNNDWLSRNMSGIRMMQYRFINPNDADDRQVVHGQAYFILEKQMPVAAAPLAANTVLESKDVVTQWVQLKRGPFEYVEVMENVLGRKIKQTIAAGEPFSVRMLDAASVVGRNQPVTMIVRTGSVEISAKATTVDAGGKGQVVDVINLANKKRMRAKVIDQQTVEAVAF